VTKLVCPDCRHENEPERIYCHNCGARLDRSGVKKEKVATEESAAHTQDRLRKMFAPDHGRNKRIAIKLGKVILGALGAAILIQMLLPPDLPPFEKSEAFAPMINMDLLNAVETHNPPRLTYNQEQVNAYLASTLRRTNSPAKEGIFPIQRLFAQFDEGLCRLNVQHSFFGLPISYGSSFAATISGGKIIASSSGGYIGRMPIHPVLMRPLDVIFSKTWATLARERKDVARLAGIEFHPQSVTLLAVR
jgi:hypothetical protein